MFLLVFSIFSFFLFVSFSHWFSLLFLLPFSRFLFVSLSLFPPLVFFLSIFCSLSARLIFPLLPLCPFPLFLSSSFVSVSFPLPSSPLLAASSSFWSVLTPLCCAPLRSVSLSPFLSWLSSLSFSSVYFASFSASSSSRPCSCPPPHLRPSFYLLGVFLFCFLDFVLFLCLAPSSFFSSSSLSRFPSCAPSVSYSVVSSFGSDAFHPPPGFPPLPPPPGFRSSSSSGSSPLHAYSFISVSASRWFSSAHPLVCLSCSAAWPASILSSSSSALFLLFSCGFRFVFSFVGASLVFFITGALMLSIGGVPFHKCLSAFCPPLFSDASRDFFSGSSAFSPLFVRLPLLPFLRSSCGYLFGPFSYGVFSFSSSSFGGFGLLHSPAYSSPSACSCLCSLGVHCTSDLPSSGVSIGWGGCMRWVLRRCCLRLLQVFLLSPLPRHFCLCLILQFLLPLFLLSSLRVLSSCLFSLAFVFLDVACLFCSWLGLSSAGFCGSLFTCGALPGAPLFSAASVLLCSSWLLCGSLWLCLSAVWDF